MDCLFPRHAVGFSILLVVMVQTSMVAGQICSTQQTVNVAENNNIGDLVLTISIQPGVTLSFTEPSGNPDNAFMLAGNQLLAAVVLDYEDKQVYTVQITCSSAEIQEHIIIQVLVTNVNDNPPVFNQSQFLVDVNEMSPIGSTMGRFEATDLDPFTQIYYTLTSESTEFRLKSLTIPEVLVDARLDYDKVQNVQLVLEAQDTPLDSLPGEISFTATTTIMITIKDGDNRPPWFQPCTIYEVGGVLVCRSSGYSGMVALNEQETGALPLKPGPLYAIDGDFGLNEEIMYSFLNGNEDGLFDINPNTGNITMLRPADVYRNISLIVLASQKYNSHQFETTSVSISVHVKSLHPPQFQQQHYEALITAVGTMALNLTNQEEPLQVMATDDDFSGTGGLNPYITYSVVGSSDFSIIGGFLFMTKDLPEGSLSLEILATDTSSDETAVAQLLVEVKSVVVPGGHYGTVDMAVLGASLGVLLLICLVVIGVLVHQMRRGKDYWKKIYEASMFRSSIGQGSGGPKEGIQYTNEAFERDDDGGSVGSGGNDEGSVWDSPSKKAIQISSGSLYNTRLPDDASDTSSNSADKEVKPILTKERRTEDGYKSVWFKEDIDPNAKEEVVIIPDSRDEDSEGEEPSSSGIEDEGNNLKTKVFFTETDLDSGLGVKIEDLAEDSESDQELNVDL